MNAPCKHTMDCRDTGNVLDHEGVGVSNSS